MPNIRSGTGGLVRASLFLVVCLLAATASANPAPDFRFVDSFTGTETTLGSLKGDVIYLDFWASWCVPCRQSFPFLNELHGRYGERGLTILGVNVDEKRADADDFLRRIPADFRIIYDNGAALPPIYNVMGMPTAYLIDHRGRIVEQKIGFRLDSREATERKLVEMLREAGRL
ncbi:MAG: TlpA disulfide reductase family protein [Natronospirillum sp.]